MKKISLIILSILCVSCFSHRNMTSKISPHGYKIGSVKINPINESQYESILFNKDWVKNKPNPNESAVFYYVSEDKKVVVKKIQLKESIVSNFKERFENMKGFYSEADYGYRVLSYDSASVGQSWIYALEISNRETELDNKIRFSIETNRIEIGIVTDLEHRATAVGLMDAFTKELMNVKLNLKPNLKK